MSGRLEGRVAFITGAARGQGRSHAVRMAAEGAEIIAFDVCRQVETVPYPTARSADLAKTVAEVQRLGRRIVPVEGDVRDLDGLQFAVDKGFAELGRLDIVIANAGISSTAPTLEMSEETWQTMIDVNLTGVWKTIKAAVPKIVEGGRGGSVVIISSLAALRANRNIAHYTAAKAGLVGLMRILAKELASEGIRVNSIHPTTVATPMVLNDAMYRLFCPDVANPTKEDFFKATRVMNGLPTPYLDSADISNAILYLTSEEGRFVTGTTHVLNAGAAL
jgi:SDR family mycofactocin-dependent oxidoreductase